MDSNTILYTTDSGSVSVQVQYEDGTFWLTQKTHDRIVRHKGSYYIIKRIFSMLRSCFDLYQELCYGHFGSIPMGCLSGGCRLFYRTLMPTVCNLQSRMDLRSGKRNNKYESLASHRDAPVNFLIK